MTQNQLQDIEQLEDHLWAAADQLRANSKLTSGEYFMPVLGIIFLRHATNRYDAARRQIAGEQPPAKCRSGRWSSKTSLGSVPDTLEGANACFS